MQRRQHDFAPPDQIAHASALPLPVLLAQLLEVGVDGFALLTALGLLDRGLLRVHLGADILDDGARLGGLREDVERVADYRGKETGRMAKPEDGDLVR